MKVGMYGAKQSLRRESRAVGHESGDIVRETPIVRRERNGNPRESAPARVRLSVYGVKS
ncbi:hypothetical protein [Bacillus marinisedimentorum]|uniref:hypothetical protein n=1 Tax=Bacillus marinisedimentorum TaxID=1821260 RepID=UPI0012FFC2C2|nr:hypothetical protein [Bacillus marinisedimentorum]